MKEKIQELLRKENYRFEDLCTIMELLRAEGGCPWDREQTHQSIRNEFIEETYEAIEGIDAHDDAILEEELGDVLLQVVFHARIAEEEGSFDINGVADGICKKLILRHPHVFGDVNVENSAEVLKNWDEIKKVEKHQNTATDTLLAVSRALPSLTRASKLQKKAEKNGYLLSDMSDTLKTIVEKAQTASAVGVPEAERERTIGELLFQTVRLSRLYGVDPEEALYRRNDAFIEQFKKYDEN